jgi:hypothetical protein
VIEVGSGNSSLVISKALSLNLNGSVEGFGYAVIDPYPGRPKILFVGLAESSHTHSWIELLNQSALNVRLFALPSGLPPKDWKVRTYITHYGVGELDPETHASLYPPNQIGKLYKKCLTYLFVVEFYERQAKER